MKKYVKEINGKKVYKTRQQIIISKDGMVTYSPTEEMILADGWVEYVYVAPEETVENIRLSKRRELESYDKSNEVNVFYVNNMPIWLDKATRSGLMLRFQAEISTGLDSTILWYGDLQFPLNLKQAIQMLYAIEVYASKCYDNTQLHIANINKLGTEEEIEYYDYTVGYPDKLYF